ncbi:hypothetical protein M440DRAFT_1200331 [Trichoderma longibrachiatum ATCC 18648]|uniref:Uncharacterized protein n=1 Tax=Trichoderma longibrachiatum ATCC 18648 TaxID=983965 RepID=A0A2T4CB39_TRILO|nr:hypothetical protein M440DRAFT_1200331 [Trichoderma longibrachiatum ATCC 18648]
MLISLSANRVHRLRQHLLQRALLHRHPPQPQRPAHLRLQLPAEPVRQLQAAGGLDGPVGSRVVGVVQPGGLGLAGQRRRLRLGVHAQRGHPQADEQQPVRDGGPVGQLCAAGGPRDGVVVGGVYDPPEGRGRGGRVHDQGWEQRQVGDARGGRVAD